MHCDNCEKLQLEIAGMNAEIEDLFIFAFARGFEACGEHCIKAVGDKVAGCLESGLFPDLAKKYMKDYFRKHNPPPVEPEKDG